MNSPAPPPIAPDLERLVVFCPSWVGDTVMATPVLRALRAPVPGARITAAVRPGLDDLLRGCPWIDHIIPIDMSGGLGPFRAARALRREAPQAVLLLPNSFRSALTARLVGAAVRVGYDRDGRGGLLTERVPLERSDAPTPMVDYFLALARRALQIDEGDGADAIDPARELFVTDEEEAAADDLLADLAGAPFLLLNPGANRADKRWPAARFALVADTLARERDLAVAVTGGPKERSVIESVAAHAEVPVLDLAARGITLGSLKAVVRRAALMVTNDTGPRHVAAALGTPLISLFGPTDHRWTALDCPREHIVLAEPFLPAELIADRHPQDCAIDRIAPEDVLAAAAALLDG